MVKFSAASTRLVRRSRRTLMDIDMMNLLLEVDLEVNLLNACERGDIAQMRDLLGQGAEANYAGGRPLRKSVDNGQAAAARLLLEYGADVNASISSGWTPLHTAAFRGHHEILGLLLAAGADVHVMSLGQTPLTMVSKADHWETSKITGCRICAKLLLSHGARVDDCGAVARTPLWTAIDYGRRDLIKIFLRAGARLIADADLPFRCPATDAAFEVLEVHSAVRAAGGWPEYVAAHRGVLAGLVAKLSAKSAVPLDAAGHVVAFYCPPGGF